MTPNQDQSDVATKPQDSVDSERFIVANTSNEVVHQKPQVNEQVTSVSPKNDVESSESTTTNKPNQVSTAERIEIETSIRDRLLEQFSQQMQRLDENHQAELQERDEQHAREMEDAMKSMNHDECERQRCAAEEQLMEKVREKEELLVQVLKKCEGQKLKIDVLKRELEGTQKLLEEK